MNLYLLRHAEAVENGLGVSDRDRFLTKEGSHTALKVGQKMVDMKLSVNLILSSPFLRARQTAAIVEKLYEGAVSLQISSWLAVGGDPKSLIEEINSEYSQAENILLVGHEPYLSELISILISGNFHAGIVMKKAGLCRLSIGQLKYGLCGSLEWLLQPKQLGAR